MSNEHCPCGSGKTHQSCCGPLFQGTQPATAEALMRSRYTAFVLGDSDYLRRTWHSSTRPRVLQLDPSQRWLGLKIVRSETGNEQDCSGVVEFIARYKIAGRGFRLHEVSRFVRQGGLWVYLDGEIR